MTAKLGNIYLNEPHKNDAETKMTVLDLTSSPWEMLTLSQPAFACSKLTIETVEQGVKYVQS